VDAMDDTGSVIRSSESKAKDIFSAYPSVSSPESTAVKDK